MTSLIMRLPVFLCALLLSVPQCMAWDHDWTVLTLARDGTWGVGTGSTQSQAIAEAIGFCRAVARPSSDCGAHFTATRGGWLIANVCGDHKVVAGGSSLVEAELDALNREISLQLLYVRDLPPCTRVVTVDPSGAIIPSSQQYFAGREGSR